MPKYSQITKHQSLDGLKLGELPVFTVLAGYNGAGKTHFLQAIGNGCIEIETDAGQRILPEQIKLHDWNSLAMSKSSGASTAGIEQRNSQLCTNVKNHLRSSKALNQLKSKWRDLGIADQSERTILCGSLEDRNLDVSDIATLSSIRQRVNDELLGNFKDNPERHNLLLRIQEQSKSKIIELEDHDLRHYASMIDTSDDPLRQRMADVCLGYLHAWEDNDYRLLAKRDGRQIDREPLEHDAFVEKFGQKPWDAVNALFVDRDIPLELVPPKMGAKEFQLQFKSKHVSDAEEVTLEGLSSGERVLVALIMTLYRTSFTDKDKEPVKLMLLDEVDAPLHPAMIRELMRIIDTAMLQRGVMVIMTTHSPTTVALAPAGSVVQMQRNEPHLQNVTNAHALAHLSAGITALSVNYQDRRVAFAESEYDADAYSRILDALTQKVKPDFNLVVLPASTDKSYGGCDTVKKQVSRLREAGLTSCFGILDRDAKNTPSEDGSILVVGNPGRYSLENYLLDPLLVAALLIHDKHTDNLEWLSQAIEQTHGVFLGLEYAKSPVLQRVVDAVGSELGVLEEVKTPCALAGGQSIELPQTFTQKRGHDLWTLYVSKIPKVQEYRDEAGLRDRILKFVVPDAPDLVSQDYVDLFIQLTRAVPTTQTVG